MDSLVDVYLPTSKLWWDTLGQGVQSHILKQEEVMLEVFRLSIALQRAKNEVEEECTKQRSNLEHKLHHTFYGEFNWIGRLRVVHKTMYFLLTMKGIAQSMDAKETRPVYVKAFMRLINKITFDRGRDENAASRSLFFNMFVEMSSIGMEAKNCWPHPIHVCFSEVSRVPPHPEKKVTCFKKGCLEESDEYEAGGELVHSLGLINVEIPTESALVVMLLDIVHRCPNVERIAIIGNKKT